MPGAASTTAAGMRLRELMRPDPVTVTEVTHLGDAHRPMIEHRIGGLPIVERGALRGLITVTDVLEAEVAEAMG